MPDSIRALFADWAKRVAELNADDTALESLRPSQLIGDRHGACARLIEPSATTNHDITSLDHRLATPTLRRKLCRELCRRTAPSKQPTSRLRRRSRQSLRQRSRHGGTHVSIVQRLCRTTVVSSLVYKGFAFPSGWPDVNSADALSQGRAAFTLSIRAHCAAEEGKNGAIRVASALTDWRQTLIVVPQLDGSSWRCCHGAFISK